MRCPVCQADNESKPSCRRCRADLSLLWALEERRQRCLQAARICLRLGQNEQALVHVQQASELRHDKDAEQLAALAYLLSGNFAEALRCHQQASM